MRNLEARAKQRYIYEEGERGMRGRGAKERGKQIARTTFRTRESTCSVVGERGGKAGGRYAPVPPAKRIGEDRTRWAARENEDAEGEISGPRGSEMDGPLPRKARAN